MPFAFIIVGIVLVVAGVRGTSGQLLTLLKGDLTGKNSYLYWMASILILGALGYDEDIRPLSRAFMTLVIVVLILRNGGFFSLFNQALATISQPSPTTASSFTGFGGGTSGGAGNTTSF